MAEKKKRPRPDEYFHMSVQEVADALGITPTLVVWDTHNAIRKIRKNPDALKRLSIYHEE